MTWAGHAESLEGEPTTETNREKKRERVKRPRSDWGPQGNREMLKSGPELAQFLAQDKSSNIVRDSDHSGGGGGILVGITEEVAVEPALER